MKAFVVFELLPLQVQHDRLPPISPTQINITRQFESPIVSEGQNRMAPGSVQSGSCPRSDKFGVVKRTLKRGNRFAPCGLRREPSSDRRKLTPLGRIVVDSRQERGAKADAFLKVPLYAALFERYKDTVLSPGKTLETEIVCLGVAEKRKGPR
jgi:hypothetical protein